MNDERRSWLGLLRAPGIGSRTYLRLLETFDSPAQVFDAPTSRLRELGVPDAAHDYIRSPDRARIDADLAWLQLGGNHLITWRDERYPPPLREIPDPPALLFVSVFITA